MARKHISTLIDRKAINDINENFKELFDEYVETGLDASEARSKAEQAVVTSDVARRIADEANLTVKQLRGQVSEIIREQTAGGDIVPEVVKARGREDTLSDRLNTFDYSLLHSTGYGVLNTNTLYGDLRVASRPSRTMEVVVYRGEVYMPDGQRFIYSENTVISIDPAGGERRVDAIYIDIDGQINYMSGFEDGALSRYDFLLATVEVDEGATEITGENVFDRRVMKENNIQLLNRLTTFKNNTNTVGAVNRLLETALTYIDKSDFAYGNFNTLFSEETVPIEGKYQIDCSSFVMACLKDISFENSKYVNDRNYPGNGEFIHDKSYESPTDHRMLANDMAKYAYDNGWLFRAEPDYSNVKVGDILFWHNSPQPHFWEAVGHVQIVSEIEQNGDIRCIHAATGSSAIVREGVYTPQQLLNSKAYTVARFPLHDKLINANVINFNPKGEITSNVNDLGSIRLSEDLEPYQFYTVFLKADFNDRDGYPWLRTSDLQNVYSFTNRVIKMPDNWYRASFFIKSSTLEGSALNRLRIFSSTPNQIPGGIIHELYLIKGNVPTLPLLSDNPIVDSGSNQNGDYVKYSDGTMVCTHKVTHQDLLPTIAEGALFKSQNKTWTFPQKFTDVKYVGVDPIFTTRWGTTSGTPSPTDASYCIISAVRSDQPSLIMLRAEGRWKD